MADLADILAGAFGGFANPNDPFGYARIQLGRQQELDSALDANARTKILQGELDLRRQMQPISIAQVQADIERLGAERKKTEAATAAQEEATKEAQYQWDKSGRPIADWLGGIAAKLGHPAAAAAATLASDPLAQLKLGGPTFDESGPAALLGLPMPAGQDTSLADMIQQQVHRKAVAGLLGAPITANGQAGSISLPMPPVNPNSNDPLKQAAYEKQAQAFPAELKKAAALQDITKQASLLAGRNVPPEKAGYALRILGKMKDDKNAAAYIHKLYPQLQSVDDLLNLPATDFWNVSPNLRNISDLLNGDIPPADQKDLSSLLPWNWGEP